MQSLTYLPDLETLMDGLTSAINNDECGCPPVSIVRRELNDYVGKRYGSEIATCRLANDRLVQLIIKYEMPGTDGRRELGYEASIYRHVLRPLRLSMPKFYGSYVDARTGATWLVLEYLPNAPPLTDIWGTPSMALAASWLGSFHATQIHTSGNSPLHFLKTYTVGHYVERAKTAVIYAGSVDSSFSWLRPICEKLKDYITPFWSRAAVVHGDYYVHNILLREGVIYPIDWEFAGIDLPEMDLAYLTDGIPAKTARECERAYLLARWPDAVHDNFPEALAAARLCLCFNYLGTRPNWTNQAQGLWYSQQLRSVGGQLGLIRE